MRKVRLIAMKSTYRKEALRVVAIAHGNTFITGQGVIPGEPSTEGGLTANQMLGIDPLTEEQKRRFPFIVDPKTIYKFQHNYIFDLDNPEHEQLLKFLLTVAPGVAPSLREFRKGKHTHYIEDAVEEAKVAVQGVNVMYEALKHIKESSFEKVKDVAMYFNYSRKGFSINMKSASADEVYGALYKVCQDEPNEIIKCFSRAMQDEMLVIKMIEMGVITQKGSDFFEGSDFLGSSMNATIEFIRKKENVSRLSKWTQFAKQANPVNASNVNDSKIHDYLVTMENAIENKDPEEAKAMNMLLDKTELTDDQADKFSSLKIRLADLFKDLAAENETKKAEKLKAAQDEVRTKLTGLELKQIQASAAKRQLKKEEWETLNANDLIDYIVSKITVK
jgi:hypothetical protein